ncbi:MAG: T9SS type A sorting domain-containing protein [Saprospirales bacterium]|nr:T9SS type A sorting domain-containing protein [Saprospirales bacterium]
MKKMKYSWWLLLLYWLPAGMNAQELRPSSVYWTDIPELSLTVPEKTPMPLPDKFRLLEIDKARLEGVLQQAPRQLDVVPRNSPVLLDIPLPDGRFQQFRIVNAPVMHPDLARKYPEINSYTGVGVQDPDTKIYFSYSPLGFNALVLKKGAGQIFIEPVHASDPVHYRCYFFRDLAWKLPFECSVPGEHAMENWGNGQKAAFAGDCQLRTYDVAIAATAEFTAAAGGVNAALANLNAILTTVNGIYINELAIQCQLVANNNQILFTNAMTDGFTNGNQSTMASENQGIIDGAIGAANYDFGHAVGTNASGGWAGISLQIGNVCSGSKANGGTIFNPVPIPQGFAMAFMHEWGHQFGANHTFNDNTTGSCTPGQQNAGTAYEPGSGSTIMSYAGTCGVMDVIGARDQYFHGISLQEIGSYVTAGGGSGCPVTAALANSAPTVSAPAVAVYNLPVSTPFTLTATFGDADGNPLTFCWEQWNRELIPHPPASTATSGPVFRSFPPVTSPTRFFPNLPAILAGTATPWEVLPSVSRTMDFRVTVRDNAPGGGCTDEDDIALEFFANAGPFLVTGPATDACFAAEGPMTVNWNVAGTDAGDVNCDNVDILLSTDGGLTFPIVLVSGTPNDGMQDVTLPDLITKQGRVMVRCSDNIFFNISPGNFSIECISNLVVTDNPATGTYEARQQVATSGTVTVPAFAMAEFLAGVEVLLNPGFSALRNCDFLARIQPCQACVGTRPEVLALQAAVEERRPVIHIHYAQHAEPETKTRQTTGLPLSVFPNPFDQHFTIRFELPQAGKVDLELVDFTGRVVQLLYQQEYLDAGAYEILVPAEQLAPGMYDCRIVTDSRQEQWKLVKIK